MNAHLIGLTALLAVALGGLEDSRQEEGSATLYLFLSPGARSAPAAVKGAVAFLGKHKGEVTLRPVLLVEDFRKLRCREQDTPLFEAIKALETLGSLALPLYDRKGLALARSWKIQDVPAFVLVRGGHAHRALGATVNLEKLWGCK